ncbi:hypothetical protein JKP88DRAFT_262407, partial [Tribonema minus]
MKRASDTEAQQQNAKKKPAATMSAEATAAVLTGAVAATAAVAAEPAPSTAAVNSMSLKNFTCDEILIDEDITQVYLGRFDGRDERALVKVVSKRLALAAPERFKRMRLALRSESGAEYSYYDGELRPSSSSDDADLHPKFDVQVICPASDRQVSRFRRAEWAMVFETPECYEKATKAYIAGVVGDGSSLNWASPSAAVSFTLDTLAQVSARAHSANTRHAAGAPPHYAFKVSFTLDTLAQVSARASVLTPPPTPPPPSPVRSRWRRLYNVLDGKKEAERVLYSDPDPDHGFIVNIDTKWSAHPNCLEVPRDQWLAHEMLRQRSSALRPPVATRTCCSFAVPYSTFSKLPSDRLTPTVCSLSGVVETTCHTHASMHVEMNLDGLYCLGIARKRGLASLRDLRAEHVPMLKEMYRAGLATIKDVYGVDRSKLRVFIHYLPQFFAFHMHFTSHLNQVNVLPEKAHLVPDIIQNLESDGDYYAKRTMQFSVKTDDKLYKLMEPFLE